MIKSKSEFYMSEAIKEAKKALEFNEVPIGAVIVKNDIIIGRGHNTRECEELSIAHAEINAIKAASAYLGSWRLTGCDIYVTIEPCPMCTGAIYQSRIKRIFFGAKDLKAGACGSIFNLFELDGLNHYTEVYSDILEIECKTIISDFFKKKRAKR